MKNPEPIQSFYIYIVSDTTNELVTIEIFNALGQKVRTLVSGIQEADQYEVTWDGKNNSGNTLSSGVYIYRIVAGSNIKTMKMMLLR